MGGGGGGEGERAIFLMTVNHGDDSFIEDLEYLETIPLSLVQESFTITL